MANYAMPFLLPYIIKVCCHLLTPCVSSAFIIAHFALIVNATSYCLMGKGYRSAIPHSLWPF